MRFLSNTYDPLAPNAEQYHQVDYHTWLAGPTAIREDWLRHLQWMNRNVVGRPQATETYTVEQLEEMHMVGIYARE